MTDSQVLGELLEIEHAGWQSLCECAGDRFYGDVMTDDAVMVLANGAVMAYDVFSMPAMSSECERAFSSLAKITTVESSRLNGKTLWHQECLKTGKTEAQSQWQELGTVLYWT